MKFADTLIRSAADLFDRSYSPERVIWLERGAVGLAVVGYLAHLGLIFLAGQGWMLPEVSRMIGNNYLAAIYTPFSIVLMVEVFFLVLAIPASLTSSIGKQFEIMSLIVIREVFADIGDLFSNEFESLKAEQLAPISIDMLGSLAMFALVALFYHVSHKKHRLPKPKGIDRFIAIKKMASLVLSMLLIMLALTRLAEWGIGFIGMPVTAGLSALTGDTFFHDMFSLMIFTDVLILLISMIYTTSYEQIFRNAGFVITTIILRMAITIDSPYQVLLGLGAMLFGIGILTIYNYASRPLVEVQN